MLFVLHGNTKKDVMQRRTQSPVEDVRWSVLRKQLIALFQMFDRVLNMPMAGEICVVNVLIFFVFDISRINVSANKIYISPCVDNHLLWCNKKIRNSFTYMQY